MKRVKRISAETYFGDVEITVRVDRTYGMTKGEVDGAVTSLADDAMRSITSAKFFNAPLSKIRVG